MASFKGIDISLFFLIALAAVISLTTEARESRFFSKTVRGGDTYPSVETTTPLPEESPATMVEEAAKLSQQSRHGYGLYGHRSDQLLPTSTAAAAAATSTTTGTSRSYHNSGAQNNGNNNEFTGGSRYENFDPNAMYSNYADPSKQYGMSDTRYLDNGRYFYDPNTAGSGRDDQYARGNKGGYGGKGNGYGYSNNNEGDEYQNDQENLQQEDAEQYVP